MEFENPSSSPSTITDEQRLLAQTKKVTLQPVNPFLKPEDAPDPIVVNEIHANVSKDSEDTSEGSKLMQPSAGILRQVSKSTRHHSYSIALLIISVILGVSIGAALFFTLTNR